MHMAGAMSTNSSSENVEVGETQQKRGDKDQSGNRLFLTGIAFPRSRGNRRSRQDQREATLGRLQRYSSARKQNKCLLYGDNVKH